MIQHFIKYISVFLVTLILLKYTPQDKLSYDKLAIISFVVLFSSGVLDYIDYIITSFLNKDCKCSPSQQLIPPEIQEGFINMFKLKDKKKKEKKMVKKKSSELDDDIDPDLEDPYIYDVYDSSEDLSQAKDNESMKDKIKIVRDRENSLKEEETVNNSVRKNFTKKTRGDLIDEMKIRKRIGKKLVHVPVYSKESKKEVKKSKILDDEMKYSQFPKEMHEPLGKNQKLDFEGKYGYWFVPPKEWYPPTYRPPVCVTNNRCPTQPVSTGKEYADLLEWDDSRRVTPPDNINVRYISEKLNSGR